MKPDKEKLICNVCGEELGSHAGLHVDIGDNNADDVARLMKTFGKTTFEVCIRCLLLGAGVTLKEVC